MQTSDLPDRPATPAPAVNAAYSPARSAYHWLDSIWLQLAVSAILGVLFAFLVLGREPMNPRYIDWLGEDGAHHYIGWELLRQTAPVT